MKKLDVLSALALAIALPGCASGPSSATTLANQSDPIPFQAASVESSGGDVRTISWSAPAANSVTVYAGASDSTIERNRVVGQGGASGAIVIGNLPAGRQRFFELVPDSGTPLIIADRSLGTMSAPNLRDVGGYRTTDGRWVRMGMLYRSDQLDRLTDADHAAMSSLNIGVVADLRTETERLREPDRLPSGAEYLVLDVAKDSAARLGGDMREAMSLIAAGRGAELLTAANREFVSLDSARSAYGTLLRRIAHGEGKVLFHCTAGKDRTGWAAAVVLGALGVPREAIIRDYLRSNEFLLKKNAAAQQALAKSKTPIDPDHLEAVMTVRRAYIDAAFAEVDEQYGSFERYLEVGLGLSRDDLAQLRSKLLI